MLNHDDRCLPSDVLPCYFRVVVIESLYCIQHMTSPPNLFPQQRFLTYTLPPSLAPYAATEVLLFVAFGTTGWWSANAILAELPTFVERFVSFSLRPLSFSPWKSVTS